MSTPAISSSQYYGTSPAANKSALDMKTFLKLLTVQLANQNPLQPMNDRDFFAQMAQLGQVQGTDKLTAQSEIQQIQSMIGKQVTAVQSGGGVSNVVSGVATRMVIANGNRFVAIQQSDGTEVQVSVASVQSVQEAPDAASNYATLLGRKVSGTALDGSAVEGTVLNVSGTAAGIELSIESAGGIKSSLPLANVTRVSV